MIHIKKIIRPTGSLGEMLVEWLLAGSKIVRKPSHDINFRSTKIEVKSARAKMSHGITRGWQFRIDKPAQKHWAFRFWFICFNELYRLERLYVIPKAELRGKNWLWIGPKTPAKWEQFRI